MNRKIIVIIAALAVVVLGGGAYALMSQSKNTKTQTAMHGDAMKNDNMAGGDHMMKSGDAMMVKGSYTDYDSAKLANAEKGHVVLFFHATWCPECKEADKNFTATAAPDGLTLLKVDYDTATDLKQKYGITMQHTYVEVDKDGKLIKKWSGSHTYDDVKAQLVAN